MPALSVDGLVLQVDRQTGAEVIGPLFSNDRSDEGIAGHHIEPQVTDRGADQHPTAEFAHPYCGSIRTQRGGVYSELASSSIHT